MKKILSIFIILFLSFFVYTVSQAASVPPLEIPGNDSNPNDYTPPEGCIHYEIPGSGSEGTFTVHFNEAGAVDPAGALFFTVTVGKLGQNEYTQVLSWQSNFTVYAVIVKGENAFNLYAYPGTVRSDTDLVSPINASGKPASVSHVSIVLCPGSLPTPTPTPTCPDGANCCISFLLTAVFFVVLFLLVGILLGAVFFCKSKKHHDCC